MKAKIIVDIELAPGTDLIGVKEDLAYYLERFADVRHIDVQLQQAEQMKMKM